MSILTFLFGPKSIPPTSTATSGGARYLAQTLQAVNACDSTAQLADYASDYSGYVREAALIQCVKLARPELLPVVAGRLNDWVPQVRQMARSAMKTLMPLMPAEHLLALLPQTSRLLVAGRSDHRVWVDEFEASLVRSVDTQDIVNAARGTDVKVARACFDILQKYRLLEKDALVSMMAASADIVIAAKAVQLCADTPAETRLAHYLMAARSQFGSIRTIAVRALLAHENNKEKPEIAVAALLDAQSSVRAVAMSFLNAQDFDLRGFYRDALRYPSVPAKRTRIALAALASLRNADDVAFIKSFVDAAAPSIRLAALMAWLKVAEKDKDAIASVALEDVAPAVRKFALQAVSKHGAYIPLAAVRKALEGRGDLKLLLLFSMRNKWAWLESIGQIALQIAPEDVLRPDLHRALREWIWRAGSLYDAPSVEQIAFLTSGPTMSVLSSLLGHEKWLIQHLEMELDTARGSLKRC
jgi:hypothetical protein